MVVFIPPSATEGDNSSSDKRSTLAPEDLASNASASPSPAVSEKPQAKPPASRPCDKRKPRRLRAGRGRSRPRRAKGHRTRSAKCRTKQPSSHSTEPKETPRMAPFGEEPLYNEEGDLCLLTTSHYIVSGWIGVIPSALRPFHIALDTGSGYNVIRRSELPHDWEDYLVSNALLPSLGDANGNRIALLGKVMLRVRFGSAMY